MNSKWITRGLPIFLLLCLTTNPASAQQYVMTLLGFAPFSPTVGGANGLNNNGDVVGFDAAINGAFVYHGGVISSLGLPSSVGMAINNSATSPCDPGVRTCTPICTRPAACPASSAISLTLVP